MQRSSAWATDQVYLAHLAVTDVDDLDYHAFERFARGAAGLAGAGSPPYRVWLYDWQVMQVDDGAYRLSASEMGIKLDLTLMDSKGPILQGDEGYSRKSDGPGNASTYVSQTRLLTSGEISIYGENFQVSGTSWMDHEYSTNALSPGQIGWDWFAIQLDNQSELMVYNIRRSDGTRDPFSSGTFIDQSGSYSSLDGSDFSMTVLDTWESPHSKAVYPSKWQLHVKSLDLDLVVEPLLVDQELDLTYTYWEGAVTIEGEMAGAPITGVGYVELTGYAGAFAGEF